MNGFDDILHFAGLHSNDDPVKLILQKKRYPDINLQLVAQQLEGHKQAETKWPTLARCDCWFYPPRINREQSSSETAAKYKSHLVEKLNVDTLADLTGGMGVDTFFMAPLFKAVTYFEINTDLYNIAAYNFSTTGRDNITCINADSISHLGTHSDPYGLILIDPARRDTHGRRVSAFEDCTPNLLENLPLLQKHCQHLLIKASPMIDIRLALQQLGNVAETHIVAINNECKEILFLIHSCQSPKESVIHCTNILREQTTHQTFTHSSEETAEPIFATAMGQYIYEPNSALMKGGCFNSICQWYKVSKLSRNTHLYTSSRYESAFPGRCFEILQPLTLNAKEVHKALPTGMAHVITRNFPVPSATLQQQLHIQEGGDLFIIATTLGLHRQGWLCRRIDHQ